MSDRDPTNPFAPLDNPGCLEAHEMLAGPPPGKRAANADDKARIAALEAALAPLIKIIADLMAESGRSVEWGEEDAFRMGEWFDDDDHEALRIARAALVKP